MTLHLTRGLPGAGKTTWAREWLTTGNGGPKRARVNRDDLRDMLFGQRVGLSWPQEEFITAASQWLVSELLRRKLDVVVDDMHLRPKYVKAWQTITDDLEVHEFPVSVDEAVARDAQRSAPVGREAIEGLARKFLPGGRFLSLDATQTTARQDDTTLIEMDPYEDKDGLPWAVLCDVDGTIALHGERSPYDLTRVHEDVPHSRVIDILASLVGDGRRVVFMSGRNESVRQATREWIDQHVMSVLPDADYELYMRPSGDVRNDYIVKAELFEAYVRGRYNVACVLDDRARVVKVWRALGLLCLQVAPGDF
ncbi:MAG: AAA family ATPase [Candidatus Nanopelagicales bacterium]